MAIELSITAEVQGALAAGRPVVALESTIIAHGMPYPQNVQTARAVEDIVRAGGAVPATIAIIGGVLKVGLTAEELDRFGRDGRSIAKVSVRDLPFIVAQKLDGATTVASTMRIAAMAGIHVFATGGIGGVHRGAERTFDISADMTEFAASDVAVVTAGAKAILDLALTLETLETLGVPVIGLGTKEFPAFYSRKSGHVVPMTCNTPSEVAGVMRAKWAMGLKGGLVVANPIPAEAEIPAEEIAPVIDAAVKKATAQGIMGKETTPFLLAEIAGVTAGRSLAANIALAKHNAKIAAAIAVAFAEQG
ncbi:pseudouridine-5-phosphate glycosidase [Aestuariivirga litoralis]|uniref:Pseudouridine-5'-phosphate glycosidase n=1 Tax=Aestuariivirga litoralis TaxID=2650924 RepID=A0A2W2BBJ3_9HYPH|nr:pseudouridine-5'-phosphate glycosidase [Aestuariivirga litoralis]PZF77624.1 pseudouridine-5-phosphate glycosidase [Aestuariivirga litoralis]